MPKPILEVHQLSKHFTRKRDLLAPFNRRGTVIPAVDGVSFYLRENETMGLVGESGCGKTTVARTILRLIPPTSGRIEFAGQDITHLDDAGLRPLRRDMQMIFQDLDAGLNPKMRVGDILKESITVHGRPSDSEVERKTRQLLEQVNLKSSKLSSYPAELSGGEKRRVGIARVLAVGARLLVADEPTSALDVSIQAQVVNLLRDLQSELGLSYLFISHDLQVVELMSDKVAVMYLGKIVEMGVTARVASAARHPYTYILWSSLVEKHSREATQPIRIERRAAWGVFDYERPTRGCRFAPRCPVFEQRGRPAECTDPNNEPQLRDIGGGHQVACHFPLGG
ncbi:MAG TPA: ABC transporter ATP-binding protein [Gallionellaceae bacterium]|nr:ABC transporter ATP-binding protein [Gallionellaceae bacterium]